ncbi:LTXXQ motif family protein [Roseibium hamelinense]|uniref:LTXXQ motif family protein n=1 Tax=Roseibium hamelinense TaxID=150831 RepID=A0A562TI56_9HYPH|nr:Spy/CpxP family protein refolding chaperone [Roseibium hamelinense]MTI42648.1 hypothetical protein [Roseibium hamelinense]TWI93272.1 LTXXQ motif family protein [Roseibium hamelinense]
MTFTSLLPNRRHLIAGSVMMLQLAFIPSVGAAQSMAKPPQPAEVAAELGLSGDQEAAFIAIMDAHRSQVKALLVENGIDPSKGRPSRAEMMKLRPEMRLMRQDLETQLAGVLTPAQLEALKSKRPRRP